MATQNPIESEGTYPLPEAQLDRFMLKVLVDYPTPTEEFVIVERMTTQIDPPQQVIGCRPDCCRCNKLRTRCTSIPSLMDYAVRVVTRHTPSRRRLACATWPITSRSAPAHAARST